jgi:plasmid stabilization system protein ParE
VSEYIISQPAIRDLESISSYFADINVEAGEKFLRGFNKRCQQLANFPNIGRSYDCSPVGWALPTIWVSRIIYFTNNCAYLLRAAL